MSGDDPTSGPIELTVDEAILISGHAQSGTLSLDDPEVLRVVQEANRLLVRTQLWGETPTPHRRRKQRLMALGLTVFMLVWLFGVIIPLLVRWIS
ncbi:hypothetical protein [Curtobacterium sp. PhB136]|uniref:hypothetical protein n=1 Tax=Curtobacterium sp. PhB136 TaxID=2485181 RepID=UPI0010500BDD|nr:hypothetical protein [Curtobacterium sp. PhB136]TCK65825.1 hypothetical protein EDF27_0568 [Curtobacterium sp. PhB136]